MNKKILTPLVLPAAMRVSTFHYNTVGEVAAFFTAMKEISESV